MFVGRIMKSHVSGFDCHGMRAVHADVVAVGGLVVVPEALEGRGTHENIPVAGCSAARPSAGSSRRR